MHLVSIRGAAVTLLINDGSFANSSPIARKILYLLGSPGVHVRLEVYFCSKVLQVSSLYADTTISDGSAELEKEPGRD